MIILESVRARSVTVYEPSLNTTPFLAELGKRSIVADNAYALVPRTSKALISILCGIYPNLTVAITEAYPRGIPARCLPELLRDQGYETAYFQSATENFEKRRAVTQNMGFEDFFPLEALNPEGFERSNYFGYEDDILLGKSEEWLSEKKDKPFLATYLTVTPHHPYFAPSKRYGRVEFVEDESLNNYLNSVRYEDFFVRNMIEQYKKLGLYENTLFVIVSDHGEAFREHGRRHHNTVIYEEGLRVLHMLHDPAQPERARRLQLPVSHLDILPTVADALGFELSGGVSYGSSLLSLNKSRPVIASCFQARACMSIRIEDMKFIHHFGQRGDEMFNLAHDRLEQSNIISDHTAQAEAMLRQLLSFRAALVGSYADYHVERARWALAHVDDSL